MKQIKQTLLFITFITALWGCNASERKSVSVAKQQVQTENPNAMLSPHEATMQSDAAKVRERVVNIYDEIFAHESKYSNRDGWDSGKYFSDSLQRLWKELPESEVVIDYDIWTCSQDYDTLRYTKVEAMTYREDSAYADVTLALFYNGPEQTIRLSLVCQQKPENDSANWYVEDIQVKDTIHWPSLADEIRNYIKDIKQ